MDEAYDTLLFGSSIPLTDPTAVTSLKQQTAKALELYDPVLGHDLIVDEKFGESLHRLIYILKHETHPTMWNLYFYRPKTNWVMVRIIFNDKFDLLDA